MTRGRPLVAMTTLIALWVGARLWVVAGGAPLPVRPVDPAVARVASIDRPDRADTLPQPPLRHRAPLPPSGPAASALGRWSLADWTTKRRDVDPMAGPVRRIAVVAGGTGAALWDTPPIAAPAVRATTGTPATALPGQPAAVLSPNLRPAPLPARSAAAPRLSLYSYAFTRPGGASGLAETRYGGSQAGAVAGYRIAGTRAAPVEAIARVSFAPDDARSLEAGVGARAGLIPGLSIAAEYRRRRDGIDTIIGYVAGGAQRALPAGFTLSAYGQAGGYVQDGVHGFADGQLTATRRFANRGRAVFEAGAGAWAGGTEQVQRLDVGPRVAASLPLGGTTVTIAADYRLRILGDAAPAHGPALTVAAGF